MDVVRVNAGDRARAESCARLMVSSEPWVTLRRSFDSAMSALQDPGKELHVVLADGDIAAFVLLDLRGPLAGYIQTICVRSDLRGRGMGSALIAWAEQRMFRDSPNVFLCVSSFNVAARRLYERLGYEIVGRFRSFIVREHNELLLRKTAGPWVEFKTATPLMSGGAGEPQPLDQGGDDAWSGNNAMSDLRYPADTFTAFAATVGRDRCACLELMAGAPALLRAAVQHLSPSQLGTPYREGGWSVRQIVHHVADSQLNWYVRTKLALTENEPTIRPFDADRWSDLRPDASVETSLVLLEALYQRWVPLLESLTPNEWLRKLYHPERGWLTLADTLPMHAWHGQHHTAQITALSKRMNWT